MAREIRCRCEYVSHRSVRMFRRKTATMRRWNDLERYHSWGESVADRRRVKSRSPLRGCFRRTASERKAIAARRAALPIRSGGFGRWPVFVARPTSSQAFPRRFHGLHLEEGYAKASEQQAAHSYERDQTLDVEQRGKRYVSQDSCYVPDGGENVEAGRP